MKYYVPIVTSYSVREIAYLYGISRRTLLRRLKQHNILKTKGKRHLFTPKEVEKIFNTLGVPVLSEEQAVILRGKLREKKY